MTEKELRKLEHARYMQSLENQQAQIEHGLQCSVAEMVEWVGERKTRQHIDQILGSMQC